MKPSKDQSKSINKETSPLEAHRPLSVSSLQEFRKSPRNYWYRYLSGRNPEKKTTQPMLFGGAWHCWNLEEHNFDKKFLVSDLSRNSKEFKALKKAKDKEKITIIKSKEDDLIKLMKKDLRELSPEAVAFLEADGVCEETYTGTNDWGLKITGNLDKYIPDINAIVELKTISKITSINDVIKKIIDEYPITAPHYFELVPEARDFYFIFQEKEPPYDAVVVRLSNEILDGMYKVYNQVLRDLMGCIERDRWTGVSGGDIVSLEASGVPPWMLKEVGLDG